MHSTKVIRAIETLEHPLARSILDRSQSLTSELVQRVASQTQFGWQPRHPRPVWQNKRPTQATDLDLLSVLYSLYQAGTDLTISGYQPRTPWRISPAERHVGPVRHGPLDALISHQSHLSFSVRLEDTTVQPVDGVSTTKAPIRSFMVVDYDGNWYNGWSGLRWDWRPDEYAFFTRHNLIHDSTLYCATPLHRNRRQSIFGAPYVLLKLLQQRIQDELVWRRRELAELAIHHPDLRQRSTAKPFYCGVGRSAHIQAPTYTSALHGFDLFGAYQRYPDNRAGRSALKIQVAELADLHQPLVQFITRAAEVAYYRFGRKDDYLAPWHTVSRWEYNLDRSERSLALGRKLHLHTQANTAAVRVAA